MVTFEPMLEAAVVAAIAAVVIGQPVISLWRRVNRAKRARAATSSWQAVPGRITSSELVNRVGGKPGSMTSSNMRAVVWYEYFVDGQRYSNNVVDVGDEVLREGNPHFSAFTRVRAFEGVQRYPTGSDVTVYVDPQDPRRSCLHR